MSKTVFNRKEVDFTKQPMFFGEDQNTQRYDQFKYPEMDKLNQRMLGYFWRPEEISLQKDRADFQTFRPEQKHIFTANLKIPNTVGFCTRQRALFIFFTLLFIA